MEYCNEGSLLQRVACMKLLPEEKIWNFIYQFCKGYQLLLDANIIHLGMRPDNILINNGIYKIADYGFVYSPKITSDLLYMAPELETIT
jgi:serine/threonine protein kinase